MHAQQVCQRYKHGKAKALSGTLKDAHNLQLTTVMQTYAVKLPCLILVAHRKTQPADSTPVSTMRPQVSSRVDAR